MSLKKYAGLTLKNFAKAATVSSDGLLRWPERSCEMYGLEILCPSAMRAFPLLRGMRFRPGDGRSRELVQPCGEIQTSRR